MPNLTPAQKKKRGEMLQEMADMYRDQRPYLSQNEAYESFAHEILNDPIKQRIINGLAASTKE